MSEKNYKKTNSLAGDMQTNPDIKLNGYVDEIL